MTHRPRDRRPTVIDLFCGAGGTGWGFRQANYRIVGAVELNKNATNTYKKNLKVNVHNVDIRELSPRIFRKKLGISRKSLDVLVGCPPCQGFSRMRNDAGAEDDRNDLVLVYLKFVEEFMPKFAVFENVPGIIRTDHGKAFYNALCEGFNKLGYTLSEHTVEAADYGVPQHRERVIVVAASPGYRPCFPRASHSSPQSALVQQRKLRRWRTVRDVIEKYPSLEAGQNGEQDGKYPNHIAPKTGDKVLNFIQLVPRNGGSRTDVPIEYWLDCHRGEEGKGRHNVGYRDVYGRIAWDKPVNTLTSGCTNISKGRFTHPHQHRALTAREAAALQGFPRNFVFYGGEIAKQVGNAVPPPLARAIAETLKTQLQSGVRRQKKRNRSVEDTYRTVGVWGDKLSAKNPKSIRERRSHLRLKRATAPITQQTLLLDDPLEDLSSATETAEC